VIVSVPPKSALQTKLDGFETKLETVELSTQALSMTCVFVVEMVTV